jgi:ribose/xylose/arabinose/galactoside ABC-type transport system permease subunit
MTATSAFLSRLPYIDRIDRHAIWIVLVLLILAAGLVSDAFFKINYLANLLRQAAPVGIAAVGVTFVMILRGVDLSIGGIVSVSVVICPLMMAGKPENLSLALTLTCLCGAFIGCANGLLIALGRVPVGALRGLAASRDRRAQGDRRGLEPDQADVRY